MISRESITQDPNIPLVYAFEQIGWDIAAKTISYGSLFGLAARYSLENV
jgi:hypothetical protein